MEHTITGEPVGSRALRERHDVGVSPASIRAVMARLEELGFASQPHASAGRVPTALAYRYYVDHLVEPRAPAPRLLEALARSTPPGATHESITRNVGRLVASATDAAIVVAAPQLVDSVLANVRFVSISAGRIVAVLQSRSGRVEHRTVDEGAAFLDHELEQLHNYLAPMTAGRTLRELRDAVARDVEGAARALGALHGRIAHVLDAAVEGGRDEDRVSIEGQDHLFHRPEFEDTHKMRAYVDLFASRRRWLGLLERTLVATNVGICIGDEAELGLEDVSIVAVRYGRERQRGGVLAVVGPLRIDYAGAVPLLRHAARAVAEALDATTENCDD